MDSVVTARILTQENVNTDLFYNQSQNAHSFNRSFSHGSIIVLRWIDYSSGLPYRCFFTDVRNGKFLPESNKTHPCEVRILYSFTASVRPLFVAFRISMYYFTAIWSSPSYRRLLTRFRTGFLDKTPPFPSVANEDRI